MSYLEDIRIQVNQRNLSKFLQLWEEYCTSDQVDYEEFQQLLLLVKNSDFAIPFGTIVETAVPLWQQLTNPAESYQILKLLIDLQTTNSASLGELTFNALKERYSSDPQFSERIRLIGLRTRENFQGALSSYDLLAHMQNGKFVLHLGGWGTGEIMEISSVRQQITLEFEKASGRRHLAFENAFKTLVPLTDDHFLSRRFGHPDLLEKEAKEDPVGVIKLLLRDLGPKSAAEIKDELCELIIPENEWTKWWQGTRSKLKKDPMIEAPDGLKDPFRLRKTELSHRDRMHKVTHAKEDLDAFIRNAYNFLRDLPNTNENQEVRQAMKAQLADLLKDGSLSAPQELQIHLCLDLFFQNPATIQVIKEQILHLQDPQSIIAAIDIVALQKRLLGLIRELRADWIQIFLNTIPILSHSTLRDYLISELNKGEAKTALKNSLDQLLHHPESAPDYFLWYFQTILASKDEALPFSSREEQCRLFESFLILMHKLENRPEQRLFVKKMYNYLIGKRYAVVRHIMDLASLSYVEEFLLLAAKCHSLEDHDKKIFRSLAAVVYPELGKEKNDVENEFDANVIWTTEEAYLRIQAQAHHISTSEMVDNALEIQDARALGDLRENSEFRFAKEKRARLTQWLKMLLEQLNRARVITKDDIHTEEVGIGSCVRLQDAKGNQFQYTILGPWDADPEKNILSFQSKLAQAMLGCRKGENFRFKDDEMTVVDIRSYLEP